MCDACKYARYCQCGAANILNPNFVLNQKLVTNVETNNHNNPIKILLILYFICVLLYHICDKVKSVMIDITGIIAQSNVRVGLWCPTADDGTELAKMVDMANLCGANVMSVTPGVIKIVWPWIENTKIKIMARFYFTDSKSSEEIVSKLVTEINSAFKVGASGAQVFVPYRALDTFVREMRGVRDDLFFDRRLAVGLDIGEIGDSDWNNVFDSLVNVRADSVVFVLGRDTGDKSDFVGRVYSMLNKWSDNYSGDVYWMLNDNYSRFEQVVRLIQAIRPELLKRTTILPWP